MSLPTSTNLKTMDYADRAQPFVSVPAKEFSLTTMDYAFKAQPFVTNPFPPTVVVNPTLTGVSTITGISAIQF